MITHTWAIEKLECTPVLVGFENVVRTVFWVLNSSDEKTQVSTRGVTDLGFDPENNKFTNYSTLDEKTVLEWVFNELTAEVVNSFEQAQEKTIGNTSVLEIVETPLPWAAE